MIRFVITLSALGLLSACGIPGGLERPDPMWGSEAAIREECTRELRRGETRDARCNEQTQQQQQAPQPQPQ
jgi:hypothetical protein